MQHALVIFGTLQETIFGIAHTAGRLKIAFLTIVLSLLLPLSSPLFAASELGNARVLLLPAIDISEESEVDFGQLSNVDGTCAMALDGSLSGSPGMDCVGNETPGVFAIRGADGAVLNISVSQGILGGITFNPVIAGNSQRTLENGSTTVTILGNLILSGAAEGTSIISYTLVANYE